MIIVGLDPGSQITGYAIVAVEGSRVRWIEGGTLRPPRGAPLPERLAVLHEGLREILARVTADAVVLEECFMGRFARAALVLGHARGALIVAASSAGLPIFEYAPRLIKMAATGVGSASKAQVQAMASHLVEGAPSNLTSDEADALAAAICHLHRVNSHVVVASVGGMGS